MSEFIQNVGSYLIQRLYDLGVRHIFGVPGDYVLGFYQELIHSNKLKVINTCDEQGAGFEQMPMLELMDWVLYA